MAQHLRKTVIYVIIKFTVFGDSGFYPRLFDVYLPIFGTIASPATSKPSPTSPAFLNAIHPVFVFGKLPCRRYLILLLKLDWTTPNPTISGQPSIKRFTPLFTIVLQGILTDGFIRPSSWKQAKDGDHLPSVGFYCRCCYPRHGHYDDNRINNAITGTLSGELQCALHIACEFGGRSASRKCFVAGECFSRQATHFVKSGGLWCLGQPLLWCDQE